MTQKDKPEDSGLKIKSLEELDALEAREYLEAKIRIETVVHVEKSLRNVLSKVETKSGVLTFVTWGNIQAILAAVRNYEK